MKVRLRHLAEELVGPLGMRRDQLIKPWRRHSRSDQILNFEALGQIPEATDSPIFIMANTWRSGSTLLQRLVVSSEEVFIWGEPWHRCDLLGSLSRSLGPFDGDWPIGISTFADNELPEELSASWIATLFPNPGELVEAHRSFFRALLAEPAAAQGREQWGAKFVRYGMDEARYLNLLFPAARFIFLLRDPVDAWRSYRSLGMKDHVRWPNDPVITATHFGDLWARRTKAFLDGAHEVDGIVVRYEDLLTERSVFEAIERHLDLSLDRSVLDSVVGSSSRSSISQLDQARLHRAIGPVANEAGYDLPWRRAG